jgi:hypothetical protein
MVPRRRSTWSDELRVHGGRNRSQKQDASDDESLWKIHMLQEVGGIYACRIIQQLGRKGGRTKALHCWNRVKGD